MKFLKALFMFVIGIMTYTATANTQLPEQKQKTSLFMEQSSKVSVESVSLDFLAFDLAKQAEIYFPESVANVVPGAKEKKVDKAIIYSVGWSPQKFRFKPIYFKEKLLDNYNLHFRETLMFSSDYERKK